MKKCLKMNFFRRNICIKRYKTILAFFIVLVIVYNLVTTFNLSSYEQNTQLRQKIHNLRVDCNLLFEGDLKEQEKAILDQYVKKDWNYSLYSKINDCKKFMKDREYITSFPSKEETQFPLAFSILVHKEISQVERLLRAIYRPQNVYCIHVDLKADKQFFESLKEIVSCFYNVFLSSKRVNAEWGRYSLLEADLVCIEELHMSKFSWKYLFNLAGQEFPLRTNLELVRILKTYNGANNLEGTINRLNKLRLPHEETSFPVNWTKGSIHLTASRGFVHFMLNDVRSKELLSILKRHNRVPDEMFYSTLNHNPKTLPAPGAYLNEPETDPVTYPFITRLKNWGVYPFKYPCLSGRWVRQVCIWGIKDLPFIHNRPELFVNKLYWDFQPQALNCLEELHRNRTIDNLNSGNTAINLSFYANLPFIKNHITL